MKRQIPYAELATLLEEQGFSPEDSKQNCDLCEDLLRAVNQDNVSDSVGLRVDLVLVLDIMHNDYRVPIVDILKWVVAESEHLECRPIDLLIQSGPHEDTSRVLSAARAHFCGQPAAEWKASNPAPPMATVLEFRPRPLKARPHR